jgi:hypothetical protein
MPKRFRRFLRFVSYPVTALVAFWLGTHYLAAVTDDVVTEDGRRVDGVRAYETRDGSIIVETQRAFVILDSPAKRLMAFPHGTVYEFGWVLFAMDPLLLYSSHSVPLEDWMPNPQFQDNTVSFEDFDGRKIQIVINTREGG